MISPYDTDRHHGSSSAWFTSICDERVYTFDVYNGEEELPPPQILKGGEFDRVYARQPVIELDSGRNKAYQYKLAWEGTHYPFGPGHSFDVVRYMCHLDEYGNEYGWEAVGGQYVRTFIGQSSGAITWQTIGTMKHFYTADRDAASARKTGKGNYTLAVFATDKLLQNYAYPIKSGYYFNPAGSYRCKVETLQYKDTRGSTEEHKELVQATIDAFSYESGLIYVNKSHNYGKIGPITAATPRGLLEIKENYQNEAAALPLKTTLSKDGYIDPLLKGVLEGYGESATAGSYEYYRYREYTNQVIYEVKETTVIDFTISVPDGQKMYTHVNMKNGDYAVLAKVGKIEFDFGGYLNLEGPDGYGDDTVLPLEAFTLDGIKITVSGSMYDDR